MPVLRRLLPHAVVHRMTMLPDRHYAKAIGTLMQTPSRNLLILAALFGAVLLPATHAQQAAAQTYPVRPIRLIIPYSPGGASDNICRLIMPRISDALGQTIVIDNRPGAGGVIGRDLAAKATPDGYTLLATDAPHIMNPLFNPKLPYDAIRDFTPISATVTSPIALAVLAGFPAKGIKDIVAMAKAQPGKLNFGSGGTGVITHLTGELFKIAAGINIVHVPYKSIAPAITDLLGGQIQMAFPSPATISGQVQAGRLRMLAVAAARRTQAYPDVPTFEESGVAGMIAANWFGVAGPAKLPPTIVERFNQETHKALRIREVQERLVTAGIEPIPNTPQEFMRMLESEYARWSRVVKTAGLKPD
jgi:tripartite-type tricarboxylate transporter receptor subunit TctC